MTANDRASSTYPFTPHQKLWLQKRPSQTPVSLNGSSRQSPNEGSTRPNDNDEEDNSTNRTMNSSESNGSAGLNAANVIRQSQQSSSSKPMSAPLFKPFSDRFSRSKVQIWTPPADIRRSTVHSSEMQNVIAVSHSDESFASAARDTTSNVEVSVPTADQHYSCDTNTPHNSPSDRMQPPQNGFFNDDQRSNASTASDNNHQGGKTQDEIMKMVSIGKRLVEEKSRFTKELNHMRIQRDESIRALEREQKAVERISNSADGISMASCVQRNMIDEMKSQSDAMKLSLKCYQSTIKQLAEKSNSNSKLIASIKEELTDQRQGN